MLRPLFVGLFFRWLVAFDLEVRVSFEHGTQVSLQLTFVVIVESEFAHGVEDIQHFVFGLGFGCLFGALEVQLQVVDGDQFGLLGVLVNHPDVVGVERPQQCVRPDFRQHLLPVESGVLQGHPGVVSVVLTLEGQCPDVGELARDCRQIGRECA